MSSYVLTNVKLCDIYYLSSFPPLLPSSAKQVCLWPQENRLVLQDWKFMNIYLLFQLKKKNICISFFGVFLGNYLLRYCKGIYKLNWPIISKLPFCICLKYKHCICPFPVTWNVTGPLQLSKDN